jgi:predicted peptidase
LLHAFTLLTAKAWTPQAEYGASLELRGAPSIIDLSKPLTAQLTQAFSVQPPSSSALQMRLLVREFAFEESGRVIDNSRILKVLGPFNGVSSDLVERPFSVSANLTGVPEGIYRLVVEVLDGNVSIGKQMRTVWFVRELETRRADIEKKLTGISGHDSAKATIRYPFELASRINAGEFERVFFDFSGEVQRSVELTQALVQGKDPLFRGKGYQKRHYWFADAKETIAYRLYVPTNWDGKKKLPMVTILHGANEDERDMLERDDHFFQRIAERRGYILLAPVGYRVNGAYGTGANPTNPQATRMTELSEKDVMNVTDIVAKEYDVDRSRMYLMGQSLGGRGTLFLGQKYADTWAAIVATAPAGPGVNPYPYDRLKDLPVMVAVGTADSASLIDGVHTFVTGLKNSKLNHEFIEVEGATHHQIVYEVVERGFDFLDRAQKAAKSSK